MNAPYKLMCVALMVGWLLAIANCVAKRLRLLLRTLGVRSSTRQDYGSPFYAQVATRPSLIAGQKRDARVGIWCFQGKGSIGVRWSGAAAGSKNLVLEFRFDGEPGYRTKARYVNRSEQQTTNVEDLRHFLEGMKRSDGLFLRVTSDLYGVSEAYFTARGGRDIVNKFRAACPAMLAE